MGPENTVERRLELPLEFYWPSIFRRTLSPLQKKKEGNRCLLRIKREPVSARGASNSVEEEGETLYCGTKVNVGEGEKGGGNFRVKGGKPKRNAGEPSSRSEFGGRGGPCSGGRGKEESTLREKEKRILSSGNRGARLCLCWHRGEKVIHQKKRGHQERGGDKNEARAGNGEYDEKLARLLGN